LAQRRTSAGFDDARLNICVNVSGQQLLDPVFPGQVSEAIAGSGINPGQLWLEITESTLMTKTDEAVAMMHALRDLGVHFEIDDFGIGYSSLSRLKNFPVETLKIDRSFIDELDNDIGDLAIVRAIIALGDSLRLSVIAEGIERRSQADALTKLGCYLAQGYLYGRPIAGELIEPFPADDLSNWTAVRTLATADVAH
jgi:EAL domain-containing protein (putative c-di-GMP-specific phosphodiesterase class I)